MPSSSKAWTWYQTFGRRLDIRRRSEFGGTLLIESMTIVVAMYASLDGLGFGDPLWTSTLTRLATGVHSGLFRKKVLGAPEFPRSDVLLQHTAHHDEKGD